MIPELAEAVAKAWAVHPHDWLTEEAFGARLVALAKRASGEAADLRDAIRSMHAADVYLAAACMHGVPAALRVLEVEHLARVPSYVATIDPTPAFGDELTQRVRTRILVATESEPPRIDGYAGRGPLGGFIRVTAVRVAQDLASERGRGRRLEDDDLEIEEADPEMVFLKQKYGAAVTLAFRRALASLDAEDRTTLRMFHVDGLTIAELGHALGMSRATAARRLADARAGILERAKQDLIATQGVAAHEVDSLIRFVRSRIDISMSEVLRDG